MCRKILEEEELPWMSSSVGVEGRAGVEVMEMRPCGVGRVKDDIGGGVLCVRMEIVQNECCNRKGIDMRFLGSS
jgi:hypothetical protein